MKNASVRSGVRMRESHGMALWLAVVLPLSLATAGCLDATESDDALETTGVFAQEIGSDPPVYAGASQLGAHFGSYQIRNSYSGQCVDVPGFGAGSVGGPVMQYHCNSDVWNDNQRWFFHLRALSGNRALYNIWNSVDGLCLDLPGTNWVSRGTRVNEYGCVGNAFGDNQLFYLEYTATPGIYTIRHFDTSLCLNVEGTLSHQPRARLTLWTCDGDLDHQWSLHPVE